MPVWANHLANIADWLGTTSTQAGVIMSLAITLCVIVSIIIASKGKKVEFTVPIGALVSTVLFTYIGWYPLWTGSVLALILAIFTGWIVSRPW